MRQLQTVFQSSVLVLLCLTATIFSAAEGQPLVSLTIPAAVMAWMLVDRPDRGGLGPNWSFALGLVGVGAAVYEFFTGGIEARILAPSHLLAYLVWIILFQRKANRHYWTLLGLTVLQIAIASLLTTSAWLGVAVIFYTSCALWTMGVFTLYRAVQHVASISSAGSAGLALRGNAATDAAVGRRSVFQRAAGSSVRHSAHLDPSERMIGWHFSGGALLMTVLALSLSGLFFLFIPRVWPSQYQLFNDSPILGARPLTGFTEDVKLGDIGAVLENDELVMEIALFDADTAASIDPADYSSEFGSDDPLFRGQVMESYANARWQRSDPKFLPLYQTHSRAGKNLYESNTLRQRVYLQPIGSSMLFACGRVLSCRPAEGGEDFYLDGTTGTIRRHEDADVSRPIEYDVYTSRLNSISRGSYPARYLDGCMEMPAGLERLQELAVQIARPDENESAAARAELLVAYFRDSEDYSYSLDLSVDDPTVDPVVDFLFNRKQGHCEYYASALALLLRAVDVPSRVVSGFMGGKFNDQTGQFEVRQLHAHLWVEAYIDGGWIPLDATPPARDDTVERLQSGSTSIVGRLRDAWERTWSHGVRLSRADQDRMLYDPIRDGAQHLWAAVRDLGGTGASIGDVLRALGASPERWISWRGGVAAFILLLVVSVLGFVARRAWILLRRIGGDPNETRRSAPVVEFYERFRDVASRAGYERAGAQTPREFAGDLSGRLGALAASPSAGRLPEFVTENYYRVRFGNERLPSELVQKLTQQLDQFERQLDGSGNSRSTNGRPAAAG